MRGEGKLSRAYAQRAPSNSDVDFLLSQVSQVEYFGEGKQGKSEKKTEEIPQNAGLKKALFLLVSIDFQPLKSFNY